MELKIYSWSDNQMTQLHMKGSSGLSQWEKQGGAGELAPGQKLPELRRAGQLPRQQKLFWEEHATDPFFCPVPSNPEDQFEL